MGAVQNHLWQPLDLCRYEANEREANMGLRIMAGRAGTGKSEAIYREMKMRLAAKSGQKLMLIVPEQMTYQTEREIIKYLGRGIIDAEVLSFKRLEYRVLEEVGGLKLRDINSYGRVMLLRRIFEENMPDIQVYRKTSSQEGFLREFDELISEMKENRASVEFMRQASALKGVDELLKRKLQDISLIYTALEDAVKDKYFDEYDKREIFIKNIPKSTYLAGSAVWLDGFTTFDAQICEAIVALASTAEMVSVALDLEPDLIGQGVSHKDWEAFRTTMHTYSVLKKTAEESKIDVKTCHDFSVKPKQPFAMALEERIGQLSPEPADSGSAQVSLYAAMNPYEETEHAACAIIADIRDGGLRWRDVTVAVGDMDVYSDNIKRVFAQYGIPCYLDVKRDIMINPLVRCILSVLDILIWNFRHDDMFEYLKTGFSSLNYNEVGKLENFALQYGIEGSKWFKEFKFKAKHINYYNSLRNRVAEDFAAERKKFRKLNTAEDMTVFIFEFLKKHKVQEKIEKRVEIFKKSGQYELSMENAQVWNSVMDIFEQIIAAARDVKLKPAEYRKMLEAGFKEVKISIIPPTIDRVSVVEMDKAYLSQPRVLTVLGANDSMLEKVQEDKGLLLDNERRALLNAGLRLIDTAEGRLYYRHHMLYKSLSSAREKLSVSYSLSTDEGRPLQPSIYVSRLKNIFPELRENSSLSGADVYEHVSSAEGTVGHLAVHLREGRERGHNSDMWGYVASWYEKNRASVWEPIRRGLIYDNRVERLSRQYIDKIYPKPLSLTVSRLESFGRCPFSYFVESVLRPEIRKIQKIEFYDIGDIYHRSIERFTDEIIRDQDIVKLSDDKILKLANECAEAAIEEKSEEVTALDADERSRYMKIKISRLVGRAALTLCKQLRKGMFRPEKTELPVRSSGIKLSDGSILKLRGRIDRLDEFEINGKKYVNIIDYKSSQKDLDLGDAYNGLQLQLLSYMSSIRAEGDNKLDAGGAYYFCIDDPMVDGDSLGDKSPEDEIFSSMSLKGYVAEDMDVIRAMDQAVEDTGGSDVIPVSFKSDGSLRKTSRTLTKDEFDAVLDMADMKSADIGDIMLSGSIDINPCKKDGVQGSGTPCAYCLYKSVCLFDSSAGNRYRRIKKMTKDEVLGEIMAKAGENNHEVD